MQLSLLSKAEADSILINPVEYGLCAELMGRGPVIEELRGAIEYGCRHCHQVRPAASSTSADATSADVPVAEPVRNLQTPHANKPVTEAKQPKLYTFDGLRSHCKAK
jgi:hypothetical protein